MGDAWVNGSSCTYDRTSGIHLIGGLAAAAGRRVKVKKEKKIKKETLKLMAFRLTSGCLKNNKQAH